MGYLLRCSLVFLGGCVKRCVVGDLFFSMFGEGRWGTPLLRLFDCGRV